MIRKHILLLPVLAPFRTRQIVDKLSAKLVIFWTEPCKVMEKHVLTKLVSYGRQGQKQVIGYAPVTNRGDGVNIERPLGKHKVVKDFERDEVEMDGTGQKK